MNKKIKKVGCLVLAMLTALPTVACAKKTTGGGGGSDGIGTPGDVSSFAGGRLNITCYEAGFGTQWLKDIAAEFASAYDVTVKVTPSYTPGELITQLNNRQISDDIVMALGSMFNAQDKGYLEDLSDVYNATPIGDEKAVKDSMTPAVYQKLLTEDGKIYQMNWLNSVCSIVLNKTVLEELFPNGYDVPNTTDELLAFCNTIKNTKTADGQNVHPFSISTSTGYWAYMYRTWWAQYEGYDSYYDYYQGYYHEKQTDGSTVRKLATNGETLTQTGRLEALEVAEAFLKKSNGYLHAYAEDMTFQQAQTAFVSQGYQGSYWTKSAMMVNGDWLENEVQSLLISKPQNLEMIKVPVISSIVETLENKQMTDATLSAVIDAIDKGETSYAGVSAKDFARIKEARSMVYTATYDHCVGIPAWSKSKNLAKEFLKFMASDIGQNIYAQNFNGLTMAYGVDAEITTTQTNFVRSRQENFKEFIPVCVDFSSPLVYRQGLNDFSTGGAILDGLFYNGTTASWIINDTKTTYMAKWSSILAAAKQ